MKDAEVVTTPLDARRFNQGTSGIPRKRAGDLRPVHPTSPRRATDHDPNFAPQSKGAALWGNHEVWSSGESPDSPAVWGRFPQNFLPWAARMLRADRHEILHVCSGALSRRDGGTRVDLRLGQRPDVVADGRELPFCDGSIAAVLLDPPYSVEYAAELYETDYPRPSQLLREAVRVVRPGGRVGLLHFLVPHSPAGAPIVAIKGMTNGCGYRIRAFIVYQKEQAGLFEIERGEK